MTINETFPPFDLVKPVTAPVIPPVILAKNPGVASSGFIIGFAFSSVGFDKGVKADAVQVCVSVALNLDSITPC